jgi:hypothetical protein
MLSFLIDPYFLILFMGSFSCIIVFPLLKMVIFQDTVIVVSLKICIRLL